MPEMNKKNAIIIIFVTVVLDITGIGIIFPIMPDLLQELGIKTVSAAALWGGILSTSYAIMQFLCSPILGSASDAVGRRKVILLALLALSVDYLILGFSQTLWILILGRLIAGIAGGTVPTATAYLADISEPQERAKNFGIIGAAFGLGFIMGPALGGILGEFSARAPFFLSAGLTALNCFFGYFLLPESLALEKRRPFTFESANPFLTIWKAFLFKNLRVPLICFFLISVAHWVYPAIWSYWGKEVFGWGSGMIGISLACYGIGISFVQGFLIRLQIISQLGARLIVTASLSIGAFSLLSMGLIWEGWMVFCIIPFSALSELLTPTLGSFLSNNVADDQQGELQGVLSSLSAITSIVSPLVMTSVFNIFTSDRTSMYFPGVPFILASVLLLLTILPLSLAMKKC
ncbi:MAG: TCR/Tet family MFS transporter [Paracoccaceae bacterium]|nr:TCR/Tet family MFS transporter [Paracoccaceae bacterium]